MSTKNIKNSKRSASTTGFQSQSEGEDRPQSNKTAMESHHSESELGRAIGTTVLSRRNINKNKKLTVVGQMDISDVTSGDELMHRNTKISGTVGFAPIEGEESGAEQSKETTQGGKVNTRGVSTRLTQRDVEAREQSGEHAAKDKQRKVGSTAGDGPKSGDKRGGGTPLRRILMGGEEKENDSGGDGDSSSVGSGGSTGYATGVTLPSQYGKVAPESGARAQQPSQEAQQQPSQEKQAGPPQNYDTQGQGTGSQTRQSPVQRGGSPMDIAAIIAAQTSMFQMMQRESEERLRIMKQEAEAKAQVYAEQLAQLKNSQDALRNSQEEMQNSQKGLEEKIAKQAKERRENDKEVHQLFHNMSAQLETSVIDMEQRLMKGLWDRMDRAIMQSDKGELRQNQMGRIQNAEDSRAGSSDESIGSVQSMSGGQTAAFSHGTNASASNNITIQQVQVQPQGQLNINAPPGQGGKGRPQVIGGIGAPLIVEAKPVTGSPKLQRQTTLDALMFKKSYAAAVSQQLRPVEGTTDQSIDQTRTETLKKLVMQVKGPRELEKSGVSAEEAITLLSQSTQSTQSTQDTQPQERQIGEQRTEVSAAEPPKERPVLPRMGKGTQATPKVTQRGTQRATAMPRSRQKTAAIPVGALCDILGTYSVQEETFRGIFSTKEHFAAPPPQPAGESGETAYMEEADAAAWMAIWEELEPKGEYTVEQQKEDMLLWWPCYDEYMDRVMNNLPLLVTAPRLNALRRAQEHMAVGDRWPPDYIHYFQEKFGESWIGDCSVGGITGR